MGKTEARIQNLEMSLLRLAHIISRTASIEDMSETYGIINELTLSNAQLGYEIGRPNLVQTEEVDSK